MRRDPRRLEPGFRLTARLLIVGGLLFLAGCTTTRVLPVAPIPLADPVEVEIDGETVELHHPYLDEGELVGWQRRTRSDSTLVRIPYEQEMTFLDSRRTFLAGFGGMLALILLVVVA